MQTYSRPICDAQIFVTLSQLVYSNRLSDFDIFVLSVRQVSTYISDKAIVDGKLRPRCSTYDVSIC